MKTYRGFYEIVHKKTFLMYLLKKLFVRNIHRNSPELYIRILINYYCADPFFIDVVIITGYVEW